MPYSYSNDDEHEVLDEYNQHPICPRHHTGGKQDGGACSLFPTQNYTDNKAFCGTDDLEIAGFYGFRHVRCPLASTRPCAHCGRRGLHVDSLVVAVDGACPGNGTQDATKSAYGVFFGSNSMDNLACRVPDTSGYSHTSQRAELSAAIAAIKASLRFIFNGGQWDCTSCPTPCKVVHLVIKSDSAYLVNGITTHIEKWRQNKWRTTKGADVKNQDLWRRLDDLIISLHDMTGAVVDFWHVPRHENEDADALANLGLREPM
ncbi:ribonuclease H-like protein [Nemania abortiva]|nr:ribonuclease H-like protein [Nemania abortiva]